VIAPNIITPEVKEVIMKFMGEFDVKPKKDLKELEKINEDIIL